MASASDHLALAGEHGDLPVGANAQADGERGDVGQEQVHAGHARPAARSPAEHRRRGHAGGAGGVEHVGLGPENAPARRPGRGGGAIPGALARIVVALP
jgi:hypothetical protein